MQIKTWLGVILCLYSCHSLAHPNVSLEPAMVTIPAGQFLMGEQGTDSGKDEVPVHSVHIQSFKLAKTEVTVGQFRQFVLATGYAAGIRCWGYDSNHQYIEQADTWSSATNAPNDNYPVTCVNWFDAKAYVAWLAKKTGKKYRLPTEAEWEYAARAGTQAKYHFGNDSAKICQFGNGADESGKKPFGWEDSWGAAPCKDSAAFTSEVAHYQPNAFGLYDMIGNVYEWAEDCYHDTYEGAPKDGVAWVNGECKARVLRGGSWLSRPFWLRSSARTGDEPKNRDTSGGFRLAQDL